MAPVIENLPAMQETWIQSLGWEDPLDKGMATHSSILAWGLPWTEVMPSGLVLLWLHILHWFISYNTSLCFFITCITFMLFTFNLVIIVFHQW